MRVYLDSSAVIKRVITEEASAALVAAVDDHHRRGDLLVSSSLAWIEVARALRNLGQGPLSAVSDDVDAALSGVAEHPIGPEVVALARRINPDALRSLVAIHVASALLIDADLVLSYDRQLATACKDNGLIAAAPTPESS